MLWQQHHFSYHPHQLTIAPWPGRETFDKRQNKKPNKINLGVGAYRDDKGQVRLLIEVPFLFAQPPVFFSSCVKVD